MKFSTVILYVIQFIFRHGAIFNLTCDDLERSTILDNENIPFNPDYNNTIFSNLA